MIHKPTQREKRKVRDKQARKERNYVAVSDIYARGTQSAVDDYIDRSSSPERVEKIKAVAQARRTAATASDWRYSNEHHPYRP